MICKQPKVKANVEIAPEFRNINGAEDCELKELCKDEPMCEAQCSFDEKKENEEVIACSSARVKVTFHSSCDYDNTMVDIRCDDRFEGINNTLNFYKKTIIEVVDYIKRFLRDMYGNLIDIEYVVSPEVKHRLKAVSYVSGTSAYDILVANGIIL